MRKIRLLLPALLLIVVACRPKTALQTDTDAAGPAATNQWGYFTVYLEPVPDSMIILNEESDIQLLSGVMSDLLSRLKGSGDIYQLEKSFGKALGAPGGIMDGGEYRFRRKMQYTTRLRKKGGPFTEKITVGAVIQSVEGEVGNPEEGESENMIVEVLSPKGRKRMSIRNWGSKEEIGSRPATRYFSIMEVKIYARLENGKYLQDVQQTVAEVIVPDDVVTPILKE
jgi:hypothetical protein